MTKKELEDAKLKVLISIRDEIRLWRKDTKAHIKHNRDIERKKLICKK